MSIRSFFPTFGRKLPSDQPRTSSAYTTSDCKRYDHPEFQIRVLNDTVPAEDVSWLLRFFEQSVAQGGKFRSGETLQVGWMVTMFDAVPGGLLRVMEPDMKTVPVKFVDAVDATLMHLRNQQDVVRSLSPPVGPVFPSLRQSVVVHVNYKNAGRILLTRSGAASKTDSGWWLSDLDDEAGAQDSARFVKTSLYQLGVDRPDVVKFFALPPGLQVVVDGVHIGVLGKGGEMQQIPGSYLHELNKLLQQRASAAAQTSAG